MSPRFRISPALFFFSLLFAVTASSQAPTSATPPARKTTPTPAPIHIISPEVHPDNTVTFRFLGPNNKSVELFLEDRKDPIPMQKSSDGVWSLTVPPLPPDFYGYNFSIDGVAITDPSNYVVKPNFLYRESEVHVPGPPATTSWETRPILHGEIHHHFYKSDIVGDQRDYYVYTPPGYDPRSKQSYPVLYLLHGYSDDASAWTAVGRANVILDNLITDGKAKPMLIVMPLGYGEPKVLQHNSGVFHDPEITQRNFSRFTSALLNEVLPRVEAEYLVNSDRNARAIAGLSMGGSESLLTGLNHLDKFSWIGAFSSGGLTPDFPTQFPGLDAKTANDQIHALWIACGTDDSLIEINRKFRAWLATQDLKHVDIETPGAHTWLVWRRNLTEFSQLLFQ